MIAEFLRSLCLETGLGAHDLVRIISTAPKRYKVYTIPKRNGGTRTIAQPSKELKAIQRFVLGRSLGDLPVHDAATGYVTGRSIYKNALPHAKNRALLKLDFQEFFPSITARDWELYAKRSNLSLSPEEISAYSRILFWGQKTLQPKCLSIGAPTSPILSNILMFELDEKISSVALDAGVTYTRYADDITASADTIEQLLKFEKSVRSVVQKSKSPRLSFNDEKRGIYTMGQRRMVTGLILTPAQVISIGRERKRLISAMMHKVKIGASEPDNTALLKGWLGFCIAVEPQYVNRMRAKYGNNVVNSVLQYRIPRNQVQVTNRRRD